MATPSSPAPVSADPKSQPCSSTELTATQWDLVLGNQGLVRFVIGRWYGHRPRHEHDDMAQDGQFGLMRAARKYDPAVGTFANYAVWWIRQAIGRGIGDVEGISYRTAVMHGGGEWNRPVSLDELVDPERPSAGAWHAQLAEPDTYVDPPSDHAVAAAALVWGHVRTDFERSILEALEDGRGAVQAAVDRGYNRSSAAVALGRLRRRVAADLEAAR